MARKQARQVLRLHRLTIGLNQLCLDLAKFQIAGEARDRSQRADARPTSIDLQNFAVLVGNRHTDREALEQRTIFFLACAQLLFGFVADGHFLAQRLIGATQIGRAFLHATFEALVGALEFLGGELAFGNVLENPDAVLRRTVAIQCASRYLTPEDLAIGAAHHALVGIGVMRGQVAVALAADTLVRLARGIEHEDIMPAQAARRIAEHFLEATISAHDHAIPRVADANEGLVENDLQLGQRLAQGPSGRRGVIPRRGHDSALAQGNSLRTAQVLCVLLIGR